MKKFLIVLVGFLLGIIVFIPKENLFYFIQTKIPFYINAKISSNIEKLSLNTGNIYVNDINIANFDKANLYLYLFYNKLNVKNLQLELGNYTIKNANVTYSILNPLKLDVFAKANFGDVDGFVDLKDRYIKLYITLKDNTIKRFLRKDKKGYYYYEKF